MPSKKQVVLIGGGGAGTAVARGLSQQLDSTTHEITLISPVPFLVWYVGALRMLVTDKGALEKQALIPYDKLFVNGNGTFKQGVATGIEREHAGGKVVLENGESVKYDVLILASGSHWQSLLDFPFDEEKIQDHIKEWRKKFGNARKVAIAGGGAVGIELAGEIRQFYPDTKVTIVHGSKMLLNPAYPDKFRRDVERRIQALGVKLILDDFLETESESTKTTTRKGVEIDADLVVSTPGGQPNTSWIISSLGKDVANERGLLRIKPTLQLKDHPNIFAVGDIIDYPEQKQVGKYPRHAAVVVSNVAAVLQGAQPRKEYKALPEMMLLTMGAANGAAFFNFLWGLMFGGWFTSIMKGKGLFISMARKNMGQPS